MRWGCVLLKGGRGSRMGYRDKSELIWRGKTFAARIRQELEELERPCFLSTAEADICEEGEGGSTLWKSIPDQIFKAGPMGGIGACLSACSLEDKPLDGLFFVSCDMPFFRKEMALRLAAAFREGDDGAVWRTRDGRLHPVCAFYSRSALPAVMACLEEGEFRMQSLYRRLRIRILEAEKEHIPDLWFTNINRPETYEALEKRKLPAILAVSGSKNTGKTALAEALVKELSQRGMKTAVIKHDGHDFIPDVPGTDSYRMKAAGAFGTAVYSDYRFCVVKEEKKQAEDFFSCFGEADLILLEGQKDSDYPKIETLRKSVSAKPVCRPETVVAYVTDFKEEEMNGSGEHPPVVSFQDLDRILELVIQVIDDGWK